MWVEAEELNEYFKKGQSNRFNNLFLLKFNSRTAIPNFLRQKANYNHNGFLLLFKKKLLQIIHQPHFMVTDNKILPMMELVHNPVCLKCTFSLAFHVPRNISVDWHTSCHIVHICTGVRNKSLYLQV